jgi:hypothetical protein
MVYHSKDGDIDLSRLVNIYPAALVELDGDIAEMSLEWTDMNYDKVKVLSYVLIFDLTPPQQEEKEKLRISFESKDELIQEIQNVSRVLNG